VPDHVERLSKAANNRTARLQGWQRSLQAAERAVESISFLCTLASRAAEARLAHSEFDLTLAMAAQTHCEMLRRKLEVVCLQLRAATYTPTTLPALQEIAREVEARSADVSGRLSEASARLQKYKEAGEEMEGLLRRHAATEQAIREVEYEVRELACFQHLAKAIG
jgi:DNA repair exonuclease SbcCD ATPase subunit